ncbi:serine hydrolase domain-containing protein [Paenibacillus sp. JX-17]|uniref:Serine hydrolase domain-containing protein n=1 Tax=Paenibacillus lacisoli TaxID=3064525 RepID=A0ABT9C9W4_9BACL|nr:serine hydrolase domain-containing protein [Paenibacillus sp. JX-17]MDO7905665.1 serine hydrolase domain-containing protein [Paenibacillus sp. JX-17]
MDTWMNTNPAMKPIDQYVASVQQQIGASAGAVCIIQGSKILHEWYSGNHDFRPNSRPVDQHSQFNVGSIRKTYLALAISLLFEQGRLDRVDDEIGKYLDEYIYMTQGITLRHLLTHSHGLYEHRGQLLREFAPGQGWAYRNSGIDLLIRLIHRRSGLTLSEYVQQHFLFPYELNETGWRIAEQEQLIYNHYDEPDNWTGPNNSPDGDQGNLFVSARDLASWGQLHLTEGLLEGKQLIPRHVFRRVTTPHSPAELGADQPLHGFVWWLQKQTPLNQLGEELPARSFQILGITGCACLVIPELDAVAVRMYNQLRNPPGYDYLQDIRSFGNQVYHILR